MEFIIPISPPRLPNEHHNLQRNKAVRQSVTTKCVHNADTFCASWGTNKDAVFVEFSPFQKNEQ
jgi:hypothetical protein